MLVKDSTEKKINACWSVRFNETQKKYSQVEREALGVTLACEKWRNYLIGRNFEEQPLERYFKTLMSLNKTIYMYIFI